jgi:hypothetical protein
MKLMEGLVLRRQAPGIYTDADGEGWRLMPVDREYPGKKAPGWYLQKTAGSKSAYQSGVFKTVQAERLSCDYKDAIGVKHYLDIAVEGGGQVLRFTRRLAAIDKQSENRRENLKA